MSKCKKVISLAMVLLLLVALFAVTTAAAAQSFRPDRIHDLMLSDGDSAGMHIEHEDGRFIPDLKLRTDDSAILVVRDEQLDGAVREDIATPPGSGEGMAYREEEEFGPDKPFRPCPDEFEECEKPDRPCFDKPVCEKPDDSMTSPKTGDPSMLIIGVMILALLTGMVAVKKIRE